MDGYTRHNSNATEMRATEAWRSRKRLTLEACTREACDRIEAGLSTRARLRMSTAMKGDHAYAYLSDTPQRNGLALP